MLDPNKAVLAPHYAQGILDNQKHQMRQYALQQAVNRPRNTPVTASGIVSDAEAFFKFLMGEPRADAWAEGYRAAMSATINLQPPFQNGKGAYFPTDWEDSNPYKEDAK